MRNARCPRPSGSRSQGTDQRRTLASFFRADPFECCDGDDDGARRRRESFSVALPNRSFDESEHARTWRATSGQHRELTLEPKHAARSDTEAPVTSGTNRSETHRFTDLPSVRVHEAARQGRAPAATAAMMFAGYRHCRPPPGGLYLLRAATFQETADRAAPPVSRGN